MLKDVRLWVMEAVSLNGRFISESIFLDFRNNMMSNVDNLKNDFTIMVEDVWAQLSPLINDFISLKVKLSLLVTRIDELKAQFSERVDELKDDHAKKTEELKAAIISSKVELKDDYTSKINEMKAEIKFLEAELKIVSNKIPPKGDIVIGVVALIGITTGAVLTLEKLFI